MRSTPILALLAMCLIPALSAHAQQRNNAKMGNRFGAKLMFGLGGEVEIDADVNVNVPILGPIGGRGNVDDDMETTAGIGLTFEAPFHEYLTAGALLAVLSWNSDARDDTNVDRYTLLDLDGFIKVRIPLQLGAMAFEPYAMLPLGFSFNFPGDDDPDEVGTGVGWNSGLMLGAVLFVSDSIGLNAELGYAVHYVTHEVDLDRTDPDFDLSIGQGAFNLGVVIALD